MLRHATLIALATAILAAPVAAEETPGRYQVLRVPLGIESEPDGSAVLLDTSTGRSWHVVLDDKGRPRWRSIEFAGGSQGIAHGPPAEAKQE